MIVAAKKTDEIPPIPTPPGEAAPPSEPMASPRAKRAPVSPPPAAPAPPPVAAPVAPQVAPQTYQPGPYTPAPAGPAQGLSLTSMILGIAGLVFIGPLGSIPAVILGHIGQKSQPWAKGFWLTGIITGYVGIAISVVALIIMIVAWVAIIGFLTAFAASAGTN
jgi:hypothetical protein